MQRSTSRSPRRRSRSRPQRALYRVTIQNTAAQPWAPPVVATHREGARMFQVGAMASDEIATVAQQGNRCRCTPCSPACRDLGDPCSVLGPTPLRGDPNGNASPATGTRQPIQIHAGITAAGDLTSAAHGWQGAVGRITIARVAGATALPATGSGPVTALPHIAAGLALAGAGIALAFRRRRA